MSKAGRTKRKRAKARKAQSAIRTASRERKRRSRWRRMRLFWRGLAFGWKLLGGVLLLLGAVSQVYFFSSRISVTPGSAFSDKNPFSTMFVLQNDGQFSIQDLRFSCIVNHASYAARRISVGENYSVYGDFNVPQLRANAKTSAPCYFKVMDVPYDRIDLSLLISYRPSFYPFRRAEVFRFVAVRKTDGSYAWTPMAK